MAKLETIHFNCLPLEAHCRFDTMVSTEINASSTVASILGQDFTLFNTYLTEEKAIEDWVRKSALTAQIKSADTRMDRAITAIKASTRAQKYNANETIAASANRVYIMLKGYGYVYSKPYDAQVGDVQSIIRQMASGGPYANDASILNLSSLVNELQAALALFESLLKQRDEKSLLKPDKDYKEIKLLIEPVYHRMETVINANAIAGSASVYFNTVINRLNPEIERLNAEFHRVRRDIADAEPAPIPAQTYTGHPLTPVTKVLYVTPHDGTVTLELGKDFNVTFKDNVEVGNAECTFHGKGAYKGRKTVTFVIVRTV